jgi:hypothetical protein
MRGVAAILAVTTLGLVGVGPAGARTDPPTTTQPQYDRAARPILESRGKRLKAAAGSTCWTTDQGDGTQVSVCADTVAPKTRRRLRVRSYGVVGLDMGMPVTKLYASLPGAGPLPHLRRLDADGRHWRLRLPARFARTTVLDLFARYPQGDAAFGAALRHVKHARG